MRSLIIIVVVIISSSSSSISTHCHCLCFAAACGCRQACTGPPSSSPAQGRCSGGGVSAPEACPHPDTQGEPQHGMLRHPREAVCGEFWVEPQHGFACNIGALQYELIYGLSQVMIVHAAFSNPSWWMSFQGHPHDLSCRPLAVPSPPLPVSVFQVGMGVVTSVEQDKERTPEQAWRRGASKAGGGHTPHPGNPSSAGRAAHKQAGAGKRAA